WVPLFPELRPLLDVAFDRATEGAEFVVTRYRDGNANLRTQLLRIIRRAGLTAWPKLFQNLRSTRETELAESFPIHVVTAWMGNSQLVATKHYLQVTDDHFAKAAQIPAQSTAEIDELEETPIKRPLRENENTPVFPGCSAPFTDMHKITLPPQGLEP
ncbi:MAG TPA: hypothetical protein VK137_06635, partial [Planctomycetaceae bacterium]|nr:hypothetical protein [Planctomycetaceae bacterium]